MARRIRRTVLAIALIGAVLAPLAASADEYDRSRAGHPLRVVAYVLHPVGAALDWLLFRPAHWLGSQPVVRDIFGHDIDEEPQR